MKKVALQCLALIICTLAWTDAIENSIDICRLFKRNTTLALPGIDGRLLSCIDGRTIYCYNNGILDLKTPECVANQYILRSLRNPCLYAPNCSYKSYHNDCTKFYLCMNKNAYASQCEKNYHFDKKTAKCLPPEETSCIDGVNDICNLIADETFFLDEKDCTKFYQCSSGKLKKFDCGTNYFDVETGHCRHSKFVVCPHPAKCPKNLKYNNVTLISDGSSCLHYYRCIGKANEITLQSELLKCPEGELFDEESQKCLTAINARCYRNRCDGRGNRLVAARTNDCKNYFKCEDNIPVIEETCNNGYFDEKKEECVTYFTCWGVFDV